MATKRDLEQRIVTLEEALEAIHGLLDEALEIEDDDEDDNTAPVQRQN